jgi:hypothetical protein
MQFTMTRKSSSGGLPIFPRHITPGQLKDTGMAMTLLALIAGLITGHRYCIILAIVLQVLTMSVPAIYRPAAIIWLGFSTLLGLIVSKIILTLIFFLVITPLGILKRVCGSEPLQLKKWKKDASSVFTERNHLYTADDIRHPY